MASVKLNSLKSNPKREDEGDWQNANADILPGVKFKVRGTGTPSWKIRSDQIAKRLQRKFGDDVPPEVDAREWGTAIHEELLRGWSGLDEAYTPELALQALTDPDHRVLRLQVLICANKLAMPDVEFAEQAIKNSGRPSATS